MAPSSSSSDTSNPSLSSPPPPTAKHNAQLQLSAVQLRDVQDALRQPLTGRRVLIPFGGSKAFVVGRLKPVLAQQQQQEIVQFRRAKTGELETMTRSDAKTRIQEEIQALTTKPIKPTKKSNPKKPPTEQSSAYKKDSSDSLTATVTSVSSSAATPNFFEIREELDEHGKEVFSEAVNVSKHLGFWEKEVRKADESTPAPETPQSTDNDMQEDKEEEQELEEPIEDDTPKPVSDQEFAALTARLDELARWEEEEEARKEQNRKHAKKLGSKGWAKGFLNKQQPSKPEEAKAKAAALTQPDKSSTKYVAQAVRVSGGAKFQVDSTRTSGGTRVASPSSGNESGRSVGFKETDQIREIPRIGQRSVGEIQKPASRPSLVSEVVRERPRKPQHQQNDGAGGSSQSNNDQPQKKLSRFAQQRMGLP